MKVNCIHCGHNFTLDDAYDDYQGLVRCSTCGGLLDIATQSGMLRAVRPGTIGSPEPSPAATSTSTDDLYAQIRALANEVASLNPTADNEQTTPSVPAEPTPEQPATKVVKPL